MATPQTELHRHLDASFRPRTLLDLCQQQGLESVGTSLEAFEKKVLLTRPMKDLQEVLARFDLFQKVFTRPEVLNRLALEAVEDAHAEGTRVVEFRYSPGFVAELHGLDWAECLHAIQQGIAAARLRHPDIHVGLICITTRDYGPDHAAQTAEFYLDHLDAFVGFDLAGNEIGFPSRDFAAPLTRLRDAMATDPRVKLTVHAGEAAGPQNVWESIDLLGATRIGHGVRSIEDPTLIEELRERRICLEVCPTSNWITQCVPTLEAHPIAALVDAGVPVSINTDDPGIFGNTLGHEFEVCRDIIGLSAPQLDACREAAWASRFCEPR